jgi:type IV pilus assembly protein PilE
MPQNKQHGFTLIELMIALAVLSILTAIAYPSYQESMTKSRRADAKSALLELSVSMERLYTATGCYNSGVDKTCGTSDDGAPTARTTPPLLAFDVAPKSAYNPNASVVVKANYNLTVTATPTSFTLTATPRKSDGTNYAVSDANYPDKICGALTLDNTGAKTEGGTGTVADCW